MNLLYKKPAFQQISEYHFRTIFDRTFWFFLWIEAVQTKSLLFVEKFCRDLWLCVMSLLYLCNLKTFERTLIILNSSNFRIPKTTLLLKTHDFKMKFQKQFLKKQRRDLIYFYFFNLDPTIICIVFKTIFFVYNIVDNVDDVLVPQTQLRVDWLRRIFHGVLFFRHFLFYLASP